MCNASLGANDQRLPPLWLLVLLIATLFASLLLPGCAHVAEPIAVSEHCIAEREDLMLLPTWVYCGNNCSAIVMQPVPVTTCVAAVVIAEPNPEFKAPRP